MQALMRLAPAAAVGAAAAASGGADRHIIKGVSYGPVPLKSQAGASQLPEDDFFCDEAAPLWGPAGRGDLRIMRLLGANLVRLYGNNPANDHTNFLDEAHAEGLGVAPGMSDYPYYQQVPGSCLSTTDFNCFTQVKPMYLENLRKGFMRPDKTYHPSLKIMNILNEPDLKMPPTADTDGPEGPKKMCRALISAFDAMLDAEREAGVTGPLINFTATFSYAICASCQGPEGGPPLGPALGQMAILDDAMRNPGKYGYTPVNDITAAYKARFTHSFNTQNPATDLQHQFLDDYNRLFPSTPVYIGEYHRVVGNQTQDLGTILGLAESNPLFLGISFFEYQVAYWKTGSEMDFGMFGLGNYNITSLPYFSKEYEVWCLKPVDSPESGAGVTVPSALAQVYGGPGVDVSTLCVANPDGVPLDQAGFEKINEQNSVPQMARFVENVVDHMGAVVKAGSRAELAAFAGRYVGASDKDFGDMASSLGSKPSWTAFDDDAKCLADRSASPQVVGEAIGWVCSRATTFNCSDAPGACNGTYRTGDWVFSRYYEALGHEANPLVDCSFGQAAVFASSARYAGWTGASVCMTGGHAPVPGGSPGAGAGAGAGGAGAPRHNDGPGGFLPYSGAVGRARLAVLAVAAGAAVPALLALLA